MREMKDSGIPWIGEIPKEWKILKIKYLVDDSQETAFLDGDWIDSPYITDNGIPYFTTGNVGDGYFKKSDNGYISDETFKNLNCKYAYSGDLIISRLNEPYGRSCILPADIDKCILAVDIVILRPKKNIDKQYICYISQCFGYQNSVLDHARGTTMKRISRINLGNVAIPIPPFLVQRKISDFLDKKCGEVDALAAEIEKQIETLEDYKRSTITEAVTKGLNPAAEMKPSGIEFIGNIPKKWETRRIKTIGASRNGLTYSPTDLCDEDEGTLVLRSSNIQNGKMKFNDNVFVSREIPSELMVREGDILICSRNGSAKLIGKNALIPPNMVATFGAFMMIFRTEYPKYMYYVLNSSIFDYYLGNFSTSTINQLTRFDFGNMKIPFCVDENEQNAIINFLDDKCAEIDGIVADKKSQLEILADYKKSLIYEYVTGKKEVPQS